MFLKSIKLSVKKIFKNTIYSINISLYYKTWNLILFSENKSVHQPLLVNAPNAIKTTFSACHKMVGTWNVMNVIIYKRPRFCCVVVVVVEFCKHCRIRHVQWMQYKTILCVCMLCFCQYGLV